MTMNIGKIQTTIFPVPKIRLLRHLRRLLLFLLFLPALFYFSLTFECYLQRRHADNFGKQYINFRERDSNKYIYEKDIYFTPEIARFQASRGRIYIYISDSAFNKQTIQDIQLEVIRENHEEIKKYLYNYSDSERALEKFQRPGFHCFVFPSVRLHIDYNNIKFAISGIDLSAPENDVKIMLSFSGIKRRVIFWTYLFKGLFSIAGTVLIITIYVLIHKKVKRNR